ncbi:MAG: rane-anchored mycosin [Pseudonocardiales bacterium]|nr:rane-anchored mycosin [Pseudonocardiales bacterium]
MLTRIAVLVVVLLTAPTVHPGLPPHAASRPVEPATTHVSTAPSVGHADGPGRPVTAAGPVPSLRPPPLRTAPLRTPPLRTAPLTTAPPAGQGPLLGTRLPRQATDDPVPPPLTAAAPPGVRPDAVEGLRRPERCTPPAATPPTVAPDADRSQLAAAHRFATGAGQVIALIDTGVQPGPRFGARLRGGGDYVAGGDGLDDCDGHGTAVAGLLAASAEGPRSDGVVGVAPDAQLLSIRQSSPSFEVPGPDGAARPAGDVRTLADAVVLAVREGAGVVNISEAVCLPAAEAATQGAAIQAALRLAAQSDVVVVAAAGNTGAGSCTAGGDQVSLPGWYGDDVLTVGAVGPDDAPAAFTVPGPWVDVAAPGTGVRSLAVGGGTTEVAGTSFAAPRVAGLAALVRGRFPGLTAAQVVDRILATARRAPGSRALGHGVVDPVAALTAVPDVLAPSVAPGQVVTADIAGTTGGTPHAPAPAPAVGALLVAALVAACLLRRRPAGRQPRRGPM